MVNHRAGRDVDSRAKLPVFESRLCPFPALSPCAETVSLSLCPVVETVRISTSQAGGEVGIKPLLPLRGTFHYQQQMEEKEEIPRGVKLRCWTNRDEPGKGQREGRVGRQMQKALGQKRGLAPWKPHLPLHP